MSQLSFSARYAAATAECDGRCPIEAGSLGRLADHECRHGRLRFDRTAACGCEPQEAPQSFSLGRPAPGTTASRAASRHTKEQGVAMAGGRTRLARGFLYAPRV